MKKPELLKNWRMPTNYNPIPCRKVFVMDTSNPNIKFFQSRIFAPYNKYNFEILDKTHRDDLNETDRKILGWDSSRRDIVYDMWIKQSEITKEQSQFLKSNPNEIWFRGKFRYINGIWSSVGRVKIFTSNLPICRSSYNWK